MFSSRLDCIAIIFCWLIVKSLCGRFRPSNIICNTMASRCYIMQSNPINVYLINQISVCTLHHRYCFLKGNVWFHLLCGQSEYTEWMEQRWDEVLMNVVYLIYKNIQDTVKKRYYFIGMIKINNLNARKTSVKNGGGGGE